MSVERERQLIKDRYLTARRHAGETVDMINRQMIEQREFSVDTHAHVHLVKGGAFVEVQLWIPDHENH